MKLTYEISDIAPYINWAYFYYAWGMHGKAGAEKQELRQEADDESGVRSQRSEEYHFFVNSSLVVIVFVFRILSVQPMGIG